MLQFLQKVNRLITGETTFAIYVETNLFLIAFWYNTKWLTLERNFLCVHFVIRNLHSLVHYQDTREPTQEKRTINVWIVESGFKKSHLKLHQLIYSGEKPHACNSCDWTFSQSHNPKAHMKSHVNFAKHLFWVYQTSRHMKRSILVRCITTACNVREGSKKKIFTFSRPWLLRPRTPPPPPPPLVGPWDFQLTFFVLFNTILGPFLPLFRP